MSLPRKNRWRFHLARAAAGILFVSLAAAVWWEMPALPRGKFPAGSHILDLSPDGRFLATHQYGQGPRITLWNTATLQVAGEIPDAPPYFRRVTFSPNGRWLVATKEGLLKLWEVPSGRERDSAMSLHDERSAEPPSFSPEGKWLAFGIEGPDKWRGPIKIWDLEQGRVHALLPRTLPIKFYSPLLFSPDGKTLLFTADETKPGEWRFVGRLSFWDIGTGVQKPLIEEPPVSYYERVFSPDGRTLATAGGEAVDPHVIKLWDVASGKLRDTLQLPCPVGEFWFTADNSRLLVKTGSKDGQDLTVIDLASHRHEKKGPVPFPSNLSPDRRLLVCLQKSPTYWAEVIHPEVPPAILELPDLRERARIEPLPNGQRLFLRGFTPDGKLLALEEKWTDRSRNAPSPNPILDWLYDRLGLEKVTRSLGPYEGSLHFYETDTGRRQGAVPVVIGRHSVRWTPTKRMSWFMPDGSAVIVLGRGDTPTIWDLPLGKSWSRILLWWAVLAACYVGFELLLRWGRKRIRSSEPFGGVSSP
jgi:WD40 repeat protein